MVGPPPLLLLPLLLVTAAAPPEGPCYRRRNVNLATCTHSAPVNDLFSLYTLARSRTNESWTVHARTNCCCGSARYGADDILPEPFSASLPLGGCQAACIAAADCTAVVWRPGATPPPPPPPPLPQPPVAPDAFDWIREIEAPYARGTALSLRITARFFT